MKPVTAPGYFDRTVAPDAAAFCRSLGEISAFDWDGAAVLVEHCDAQVPRQRPANGLLTLGREIDVISELAGSPIGLSLNWGRSLLELRDPDRVAEGPGPMTPGAVPVLRADLTGAQRSASRLFATSASPCWSPAGLQTARRCSPEGHRRAVPRLC